MRAKSFSFLAFSAFAIAALASVTGSGLGSHAFAQDHAAGTPVRVRGTVEKLDGDMLTVKSRAGQTAVLKLAPDAKITGMVKLGLADIKDGAFIGSAAVKGADGKLHAQEVTVFPEGMRGRGEGQYPWDTGADVSMTNATVSGVAEASGGRSLKLAYKGGTAEIDVAPETPVVTFAPGDAGLLKPGAAVVIFGEQPALGTMIAHFVSVEKDGVKPPM